MKTCIAIRLHLHVHEGVDTYDVSTIEDTTNVAEKATRQKQARSSMSNRNHEGAH